MRERVTKRGSDGESEREREGDEEREGEITNTREKTRIHIKVNSCMIKISYERVCVHVSSANLSPQTKVSFAGLWVFLCEICHVGALLH